MNIVIACKTVRKELEKEMTAVNCYSPVVWIDHEFHETPDKLNVLLQEILDSISGATNVLLCYGFCGNAVLGLVPHGFNLIFPKVDDCISLLMGSNKRRKEYELGTYFFTRGWLENNKSIITEYEILKAKYGETSADYVYEVMLGGYTNAIIVDTQTSNVENMKEETITFSDKFNLTQEVVDGDLNLFRRLVTEDWDDNFIQIKSEEKITKAHFECR